MASPALQSQQLTASLSKRLLSVAFKIGALFCVIFFSPSAKMLDGIWRPAWRLPAGLFFQFMYQMSSHCKIRQKYRILYIVIACYFPWFPIFPCGILPSL